MHSKNKPKQSETIDDLPLELISDILTRLPVKLLLKFRCVCKSWLLLISSSQFVKTHLASTKSKNYDNYSLVLLNSDYITKHTYFTCTLSHYMRKTGSIDLNVLDFHVENNRHIQIRGICNGLLYIEIGLYNPATRKFKFLPPLPNDYGHDISTAYGFCYDEVNDDYKIVELYTGRISTSNMTKIHVYSLRNDSWMTIDYPFEFGVVLAGRGGTSIGGVIYWSILNAKRSYSIFSLDITAYTYSTTAGPKIDDGFHTSHLSLGAFGGCLVSAILYFPERMDVWAMKVSWIKIASISYLPRSCIWPPEPFVLDNGEIVLDYEQHDLSINETSINVVVCNLSDKSFVNDEIQDNRDLREMAFLNHVIHHDKNHDYIRVLHSVTYPVYFESLVAPSFDGE